MPDNDRDEEWDEADLESVNAKMKAAQPGGITYVTDREIAAMRANQWRQFAVAG